MSLPLQSGVIKSHKCSVLTGFQGPRLVGSEIRFFFVANEPWRIEKMTSETCWDIDGGQRDVQSRRRRGRIKVSDGGTWNDLNCVKASTQGSRYNTYWVTNKTCQADDGWKEEEKIFEFVLKGIMCRTHFDHKPKGKWEKDDCWLSFPGYSIQQPSLFEVLQLTILSNWVRGSVTSCGAATRKPR